MGQIYDSSPTHTRSTRARTRTQIDEMCIFFGRERSARWQAQSAALKLEYDEIDFSRFGVFGLKFDVFPVWLCRIYSGAGFCFSG